MMNTLTISYPETIPAIHNLSPEIFEEEARLAMAVKLYEIGRVSSGQAAELANIPRVAFLLTCHRFGAWSVDCDHAEIDAEREEIDS